MLALGQATRLTDYVQRQTKEYRAGVRFGATSATDDAEGPIVATAAEPPTRAQLESALARFVGTIEQTPPSFSAAHVDGQRAYRLARKGKAVELQPRSVRIDHIEVRTYEPPDADVTIVCGKGTYVRSIARDLGRDLGCGAYLTSLRRTAVGPFLVEEGLPPDASAESYRQRLRPLGDAVGALMRIPLTDDEIRRLTMGQAVATTSPDSPEVAAFDDAGALRAIVTIQERWMRPAKVFV